MTLVMVNKTVNTQKHLFNNPPKQAMVVGALKTCYIK